MFKVKANRDRPDFRVLIDLLFEAGRDVDTDGDCRFPADRSWTDVYIRDRESDAPSVAAWVHEDYWDEDGNCFELIFHVESQDKEAEEAVAIYLYDYCGKTISSDSDRLHDNEIEALRQRHIAKILRADKSEWHICGTGRPPRSSGSGL